MEMDKRSKAGTPVLTPGLLSCGRELGQRKGDVPHLWRGLGHPALCAMGHRPLLLFFPACEEGGKNPSANKSRNPKSFQTTGVSLTLHLYTSI